MTTCKSCNRALISKKERDTGLCEMCRRYNHKCAKCGAPLVPGSSERDTGMCARCRIVNTTCKKCGKKLYGNEKNLGVCDKCRRGF